MNGYLIDTNVVMRYPSVFTNFENVVIHLATIEELDRLKESDNPDLAYRARKGAKSVSHYLDQITIEQKKYRTKVVDDILWKCAKAKKYTLVTNDLTLSLKAKFHGVTAVPYKNGDSVLYTGSRISLVDDENKIDEIAKEMTNDLYQNEYIVFKNTCKPYVKKDGNEDFSSVKQFVKKGDSLVEVTNRYITNSINKKITARNPEQKCLINALFDDEVKIICAGGTFGTGKQNCSLVV